ncbi:hypothetical protein U1Q18_010401, partial [Sarracenia purpurea var. burkii]
CEGAQQWRAEHSGGRIEQRRRRRAKLVRRGLTVVRCGAVMWSSGAALVAASSRRSVAMGAQGRDGTARGGAMARRRRLAVVRAGATRRLKTEEQRWCTALGRLAQATTMVETRLAGAAAWL